MEELCKSEVEPLIKLGSSNPEHGLQGSCPAPPLLDGADPARGHFDFTGVMMIIVKMRSSINLEDDRLKISTCILRSKEKAVITRPPPRVEAWFCSRGSGAGPLSPLNLPEGGW